MYVTAKNSFSIEYTHMAGVPQPVDYAQDGE